MFNLQHISIAFMWALQKEHECIYENIKTTTNEI